MNPSASSSSRWKVHELEAYVEDKINENIFVPFIALTETWLSSHIADAQVLIKSYDIIRSDRTDRIGGGVLLYVNRRFPISDSNTFDDGMCQVLSCQLSALKLSVFVVYRPPNATFSSFDSSLCFIQKEIDSLPEDYQIVLTGDFNFPCIDWQLGTVLPGSSQVSISSANRLLDTTSSLLLNQYIHCSTRGRNTLDLFFTNNPFLVVNAEDKNTHMSDHKMVEILLSLSLTPQGFMKEVNMDGFQGLDFDKADFTVLSDHLGEVDWDELFNPLGLEVMPGAFTEALLSICEEVVPKRTKKSGKPRKVKSLRRKRRRLTKKIEHLQAIRGNPGHIEQLKRKVAIITFDIAHEIHKDLDRREFQVVSKIKDNPKAFYGYANKHSNIRNEISTLSTAEGYVTDQKTIANVFQSQFSSVFSDPHSDEIEEPSFASPNITTPMAEDWFQVQDDEIDAVIGEIKPNSSPGPDGIPAILLKKCKSTLIYPVKLLIQKSINEKTVPKYYKSSYICPLFKKGDRSKAENYRPISKTSHIIKIHERVLRRKIVQFIESNALLSQNQHGFRCCRNTMTQLLQHFDAIYEGLLRGFDTDSIYLDYEKAFDKVDHRLLLAKLKKYQFPQLLIDWIRSFLTDRVQTVVIKGKHSRPHAVVSGVPQGSVLGPVLFILFINDIENCIAGSTIGFFADDTRISCQISSSADVQILQNDLYSVIEWSAKNNMRLHSQKFDLMIHRANLDKLASELPFHSDYCSYRLPCSSTLYETCELRDLGLMVSASGSWAAQINKVVQKARGVSAWVLSVFKSRERDVLMTLYKSLVRSHVEYCSPVWNPSKIEDIKKLEDVQRQYTRKIAGLGSMNYHERLSVLDIMSLQRRRERYIIIHMWKILNGEAPNISSISFRPPSRLGVQAELRPLRTSARPANQSLFDGSFAMTGPTLWNVLPAHLHTIQKFQTFKSSITKFLKSIPDYPPVPGYPSSGSNSIVGRRTGGGRLGL